MRTSNYGTATLPPDRWHVDPDQYRVAVSGKRRHTREVVESLLHEGFRRQYVLQAGRFNMVDLYSAHPFTGGEGIDRFMNLSLDAPPVSARSFSRRLTHARRIQCVLADTHALRWR